MKYKTLKKILTKSTHSMSVKMGHGWWLSIDYKYCRLVDMSFYFYFYGLAFLVFFLLNLFPIF